MTDAGAPSPRKSRWGQAAVKNAGGQSSCKSAGGRAAVNNAGDPAPVNSAGGQSPHAVSRRPVLLRMALPAESPLVSGMSRHMPALEGSPEGAPAPMPRTAERNPAYIATPELKLTAPAQERNPAALPAPGGALPQASEMSASPGPKPRAPDGGADPSPVPKWIL